jgi:peptide/nickel transport system substrate-binding protein
MKPRRWAVLCCLLLLSAACASAPAAPVQLAPAPQPAAPRAKTRIVAGIQGDPVVFSQKLNTATARVPGTPDLEMMLNSGLSTIDSQGQLRPQLAEAVPSVENGLWMVAPDGRMSLTWKIRAGARWHDGTPLTSDDLVFTVRVGRDSQQQVFRDAVYEFLDRVEATDPQTVVTHWKQPYVYADSMFSHRLALPLPKHLLEPTYLGDPASFTQLSYWSEEFVGTGPYALSAWERSTNMVLRANETYALGRPKIDEIEVRFIPDGNTMIANVLAGEVELVVGRGPSLEQALEVRDRLGNAVRIDTAPVQSVALNPQHLNPTPAVVSDVLFRRALLQAIDRQQLVEAFQSGIAPIAHSSIAENMAEFREIESRIVKYDYDPRRAMELLRGLGYTAGADGGLRDASGERLAVEIWGPSRNDLANKVVLSVADSWQRLGVATTPFLIPPQRETDRPYVSSYPAFNHTVETGGPRRLTDFHSTQARAPETNYSGNNIGRYRNAELDVMIERYAVAIPRRDRIESMADVVHHLTDQVVVMGLFRQLEPLIVSSRITGPTARYPESTHSWNSWEWEVR